MHCQNPVRLSQIHKRIFSMPNIIRRPRSRPSPRQSSRASDHGTHLTYEERSQIYTLSQSPRLSQRAIASALKLPRSTVQSAIYAMTKTSRRRQDRKPTLITPVGKFAPADTISSSAIYGSSALPQLFSHRAPSAAPTVPSFTTPIPENHHRYPLQLAVEASGWDTTNGLRGRWVNFSSEGYDLHHQFRVHKDSNIGLSLPRNWPKPTPIEPRVAYESAAYRAFSLPISLH